MYNVTTTKDGVTRTYVAHVENGMPRLTPDKVLQTPKAPNGVTVQFPVKEKDIWEFHNKARVALEFFEPKPKVNDSSFVAHKQSYVLKGLDWGLRTEARTAAHGYQARAIMGKVQYQVGGIDESRTNSLQKKVLEMPLDMHFPLGALEFATSRETLQLSEKTVKAILGMCDRIVEEAITSVRQKIDACQHVWEAQVLLFSILNQTSNSITGGPGMSGLIREALQKGKLYGQYKNFVLSEQKAVIEILQYAHINITKFERNHRDRSKRAKKEPFIMITPDTLREDKKLAKSGDPIVIARNRHSITVKPEVLFIINDTKHAGDKYIHYFIQESGKAGASEVYLIHRPKSDEDADLASVVKNAKKMLADMGNPPVKMLSEFVTAYAPIFAQRRAAKPSRTTRSLVIFKSYLEDRVRRNSTGWSRAWDAASDEHIAAPGKKFYVALDKLVAVNAGFDDAWDFRTFLDHVIASGKFGIDRNTPIYGVRYNHKVLKNNKGEWVELLNYIYTRVNEIMTPQKTQALSLYLTPFNDDLEGLLNHIASHQPLTNSPVQMFAVALADAKSIRFDNFSSFKRVLDLCEQRGKYSEGKTVNFNAKWEQIKRGYPMLQFVGSYNSRDSKHTKTLVDYIRQVDEQNFRETAALAAASNQ